MLHCTITSSHIYCIAHRGFLIGLGCKEGKHLSRDYRAHGFDKRRWFDLTWVRYRRITLWADPPRANVIVGTRAVVFSVTMRNASDCALGPPAKSFIIRKCITRWVSIPSIAASPVIFIQFLNKFYPPLTIFAGRTISASIVRSTQRWRCANQARQRESQHYRVADMSAKPYARRNPSSLDGITDTASRPAPLPLPAPSLS